MNSKSILKWLALGLLLVVSACVSQRPAPVVDRSGRSAATTAAPAVAPPTAREAKDGVYIAQQGDTLANIALAFGVDPRDLARWNNIPESSAVRSGQTLRVIPPADVATASPITGSGQAEVRPLPAPGAGAPAAPTPLPPATPPPSAVPPAVTPPVILSPPESPRAPSASLPWQWPTAGKVIETFDDPRNKGIDIAGTEGAPVQAAADGEVVYVGSAVRGYGNLVIVRHSDEFITAYAHNRKVLVAEKQSVKRGQAIAELGRSDADRPKLHFEIRHQGKPVDPLKYLPAR